MLHITLFRHVFMYLVFICVIPRGHINLKPGDICEKQYLQFNFINSYS